MRCATGLRRQDPWNDIVDVVIVVAVVAVRAEGENVEVCQCACAEGDEMGT